MKVLNYLVILTLLACLTGCNPNDDEKDINADVETYIRLLKSNQYDSPKLPSFTPGDIPGLLQYRNDTQLINQFPRNPISSYHGGECKLGMYVLWTIESIRAESINHNNYMVMGFPSQNPVLALKASDQLVMVFDDTFHAAAAQAYYGWWTGNQNTGFDAFKSIDPLEGTDYRWH